MPEDINIPPSAVFRLQRCSECGQEMELYSDPACSTELLNMLANLAICVSCSDRHEYEYKRWCALREEYQKAKCKLKP